jgi:hypothetical protein
MHTPVPDTIPHKCIMSVQTCIKLGVSITESVKTHEHFKKNSTNYAYYVWNIFKVHAWKVYHSLLCTSTDIPFI